MDPHEPGGEIAPASPRATRLLAFVGVVLALWALALAWVVWTHPVPSTIDAVAADARRVTDARLHDIHASPSQAITRLAARLGDRRFQVNATAGTTTMYFGRHSQSPVEALLRTSLQESATANLTDPVSNLDLYVGVFLVVSEDRAAELLQSIRGEWDEFLVDVPTPAGLDDLATYARSDPLGGSTVLIGRVGAAVALVRLDGAYDAAGASNFVPHVLSAFDALGIEQTNGAMDRLAETPALHPSERDVIERYRSQRLAGRGTERFGIQSLAYEIGLPKGSFDEIEEVVSGEGVKIHTGTGSFEHAAVVLRATNDESAAALLATIRSSHPDASDIEPGLTAAGADEITSFTWPGLREVERRTVIARFGSELFMASSAADTAGTQDVLEDVALLVELWEP